MRPLFLTLLLIFFLMTLSPSSYGQMDIVLGAVSHANGSLLANPPLPILFNKKGGSKFSVQPSYFSVTESAEGDIKELDYQGYGLAGIYNRLLSENWGYYILASGTQVSGEIRAPGQNSSGQIESSDLQSQLFMLSGGVTLNLYSNSYFSLPLFFGPVAFSGSFQGRFVHTNTSNVILDDFDAETKPAIMGYLVGLQMGIHLSRHFSLNPYWVMVQAMSEEDKCQKFTATEVRVSGSLFDQSSQNCQSNNTQSQFEFDPFLSSFGLNLLFPSIGLGVNAMAESGEVPLFQGTKIQMVMLSFSFGTP